MSAPASSQDISQPQVVVAYDFSAAAAGVLDRAAQLVARAPFHTLHVIAVIDRRLGIPAVPIDETGVDFHYADKVQAELAHLLGAALVAHRAPRWVEFFTYARFGKPAPEILRLAEELGADLIIVGSHGHVGVRRLLLGSTSERVVREAGCPVIVARPKTYPTVVREPVVEVEPHLGHYVPPHRYRYDDNRVLMRPADWPLL
jgi:nucleotide-binding universal stress UspA family protein